MNRFALIPCILPGGAQSSKKLGLGRGRPLSLESIIERIHAVFGVAVDRESLVSSLTKKVARGDRFIRTEKNTFGLRPESK